MIDDMWKKEKNIIIIITVIHVIIRGFTSCALLNDEAMRSMLFCLRSPVIIMINKWYYH